LSSFPAKANQIRNPRDCRLRGEQMADGKTFQANLYIAAVLCTGLTAVLASLVRWELSDPLAALGYSVAAVLSSRMKVSLPGVKGTLSVNFLVLLLAITQLTWSETLLMASSSFTLQYVWHSREKRQPLKMLFNLGNAAISITVGFALYHLPILIQGGVQEPVRLVLVASAYFLVNTAIVAGVIALTENRSMRQVWHESYYWSFPFYRPWSGWTSCSTACLDGRHGLELYP
jgi:hypothetical protein